MQIKLPVKAVGALGYIKDANNRTIAIANTDNDRYEICKRLDKFDDAMALLTDVQDNGLSGKNKKQIEEFLKKVNAYRPNNNTDL